MKRFRALIFDVDGTLAETEEIHRRAFNETFAYFDLGWEWSIALYKDLLGVAGGKERIRQFVRLNAGCWNDISDGEIAELHRFKTARYTQLVASGACSLRPGVTDAIHAAAVRGQRLAIATTTSRHNVEALFSATLGKDGTTLFSAIVAGDEVRQKKPAPDVYLKVLSLLETSNHECLAIEDSGNGFVAASRAGIPALITRSTYFRDDEFNGAFAVIDSLDDLDNFEIPIKWDNGPVGCSIDTISPPGHPNNIRAVKVRK
jgi:HAD superfamily hydrolase (TIGR01509 family)